MEPMLTEPDRHLDALMADNQARPTRPGELS